MANRQTRIQTKSSSDGEHQLDLTAHETDSPILPVAQLEKLHQFRPDLVDWVITNTQNEGEERRKRQRRVDRYILIERMGGLVFGGGIAIFGIAAAAYVAIQGHDWVAGILGGGTLVSIVYVLVTGKKPERQESEPGRKK